jgi:phosphoribosyl 1,2-cyclic phosphodiesterase
MKVIVLASGSKGNVTYVEYQDTKILIDFGMNLTYVKTALLKHDIHLKDIDAILITHTHSDHISGLPIFLKNYKTKVYITEKMNDELNLELYEIFDKTNIIKDIKVDVIKTSHDKPSVGFVINESLVYITDTGYLKEVYYEKLSNKDMYIFESNHDLEMLNNGPYPYYFKQRIWSDKGHLSNEVASEHLKNLIGDNTKHIVLAHLSETNNDPEIAYNTLLAHLGNTNINIVIAKQNEPLEPIEF